MMKSVKNTQKGSNHDRFSNIKIYNNNSISDEEKIINLLPKLIEKSNLIFKRIIKNIDEDIKKSFVKTDIYSELQIYRLKDFISLINTLLQIEFREHKFIDCVFPRNDQRILNFIDEFDFTIDEKKTIKFISSKINQCYKFKKSVSDCDCKKICDGGCIIGFHEKPLLCIECLICGNRCDNHRLKMLRPDFNNKFDKFFELKEGQLEIVDLEKSNAMDNFDINEFKKKFNQLKLRKQLFIKIENDKKKIIINIFMDNLRKHEDYLETDEIYVWVTPTQHVAFYKWTIEGYINIRNLIKIYKNQDSKLDFIKWKKEYDDIQNNDTEGIPEKPEEKNTNFIKNKTKSIKKITDEKDDDGWITKKSIIITTSFITEKIITIEDSVTTEQIITIEKSVTTEKKSSIKNDYIPKGYVRQEDGSVVKIKKTTSFDDSNKGIKERSKSMSDIKSNENNKNIKKRSQSMSNIESEKVLNGRNKWLINPKKEPSYDLDEDDFLDKYDIDPDEFCSNKKFWK